MSVNVIESGDLFAAGAEAIVNPVNCVGTMGKGLALAFKLKFPANNLAYQAACRRLELAPGGIHVFDQGEPAQGSGQPRWLVNLATKNHWRDDSKIEWVRDGAAALCRWATANGVKSIACPALGAGNGRLPWPDVLREVTHAFRDTGVALQLFAPQDAVPVQRAGWRPK